MRARALCVGYRTFHTTGHGLTEQNLMIYLELNSDHEIHRSGDDGSKQWWCTVISCQSRHSPPTTQSTSHETPVSMVLFSLTPCASGSGWASYLPVLGQYRYTKDFSPWASPLETYPYTNRINGTNMVDQELYTAPYPLMLSALQFTLAWSYILFYSH